MKGKRIAAALSLAAAAGIVAWLALSAGRWPGPDDPAALGRALGPLSLLPAVLAVLLAFLTHEVVMSLLCGFAAGAAMLTVFGGGGAGAAFERCCTGLIATVSKGDNCAVIILCLAIGGMMEVIRVSGGFETLARRLTRRINTPKKANLIGELLGVIIFFDDYANALVVGPVMKPVTDKLGVSREKLAYLVDSTAAPITGVAIVSSWVAVDVSVITQGFAEAGLTLSPYGAFLESIPYCFYCLFCLLFILMSSLTGREYGPMLTAERRARQGEPLRRGSVLQEDTLPEPQDADKHLRRILTALVPILALCVCAFVSFYVKGRAAAVAAGTLSADAPLTLETLALSFGSADTIFLVMAASILGSLIAVGMGWAFRLFTLPEAFAAWLRGAAGLLPTVTILALAWSLAATVEELGTVYYVVDVLGGSLPWFLAPTLIFLVCCVISFAAGSFGCMFLVMPMAIPVAVSLIGRGGVSHPHAFLICSIASVLSGAIFGDHCSPITDCTILSSMGSGCDNMDHVRTQMPYALTVAAVSVLCGSLPAAFGLPVWLCLPAGCAVLLGVLLLFGRSPEIENTNHHDNRRKRT